MKKSHFTLLSSAILFFIYPLEGQFLSPSSSTPQGPAKQLSPIQKPLSKTPDKQRANDENIVLFTPPNGWMMADSSTLLAHVKLMVVGKGPTNFPPSINLTTEPYKGTLKQYLKIVKNMNAAKGYDWKDLGTIQTQSGTASLSQVDTKSQWGEIRLMHVILIKNGSVYILTASALKNEFSLFYKDFFDAMRSLKIAKDVYELVPNSQQRSQIKAAADKIQTQWKALLEQKQEENPQMDWSELQENIFKSKDFQSTVWEPLKEMLTQKYNQLGAEWHSIFLQKLEDQLFSMKFNQQSVHP